MEFVRKLAAIWRNVSIVQRALLIAVVLTLAVVGALVVRWARQPDMTVLYREISPEEASKMTEKIAEKGIAYELREGGTSIYVPKEKVYQLRLDMAREGLPVGQQGGYKIFDSEKIGISPFVQSVNLKRALQDELAKSIQMIDGVVYARVHIVSGEQKLFSTGGEQTSASVVLKLRAGYRLSGLNIAAITHLVAGSVEGLKPGSVTVVDSEGNLLSGESDQKLAHGAGTVQDYKERVEENLSKKVEDMLNTVLGPRRAAVQVSAVIDMNSVSTVKESYEPKGVVTKEEITSGSENGSGATAAAGQTNPGSTKKDESIITEYEVGKTVKQEVVLPGRVTSVKVAAFVDLSGSAADANNPAGGGTATKMMTVTDVQEIIKNALGLEDTTAIKVVDVKFNRPTETLIEEEGPGWMSYLAIVRHASLGIMAVCALLVLKIFRGAKKKAGEAAGATGQLAEGVQAGALPAGGAASSEPLMLRRQIANVLSQNPEQVRRLFASWVEEKGG